MVGSLFQRLKPPTIGAMRHRLIIEAPNDVADGAGGVTRSYAEVDRVWASLETINAVPALVDNRPGARATHRILIRWRADIDTSKRFRLDGRVFRMCSIADADAHRKRLAIMVEEETP